MRKPHSRKRYRAIWKIHRWVWDATGGRLGRRAVGMSVLELVTTGHKSGERRRVLLNYLTTPDGPAVVGSNVGDDSDPAWAKNLRAHLEADVREAGRWHRVRARQVDGEDYERLFGEFVKVQPDYGEYRSRADRHIPVFVLEAEPGARESA